MENLEQLAQVMDGLELLDGKITVVFTKNFNYYIIHLDVKILDKNQIKTLLSCESLEEIEPYENKVRLTFRINK